MAVKVVGACRAVELDKRFYMPGVRIEDSCPNCGEPWVMDLARGYLGYPVVGQPTNAYGYCAKCEHEWPVMVVVRVTLEPAPQTQKAPEP